MNAQPPQVDYGNWVARKFFIIPAVLALAFAGLSLISPFFLIGAFLFLAPAAYFAYAYRQFSPRGGNLQAKIRSLVFDHLSWDGSGRLLDIGCGNGALAIEAAVRFPESRVTGVDYWGGQWEYSLRACERNARIAGVAERASFEKASAANLPFGDGSFDAAVSNLVFHEVRDAKDKRDVIREALRVVRRGGAFAFQDLFLWRAIYGEPDGLLATIKSWGIEDVHLADTSLREFIPRALKLPFMVGRIAIIHGRK